jgi:probable FeS assembly SUF system protein SufT
MQSREIITLSKTVSARLVPSGAVIELPEGTEVFITQDLGGFYTVNVYGNLACIDASDADALGKEVKDDLADIDVENTPLEDLVLMQLKSCYDPEIPVNIVDLGLIYETQIEKVKNTAQYKVFIQMTLTAPGCGMGPTLVESIKQKLLKIPKIKEVEVEMVFDPPWTQERMSDAAKLQLGLL